MTTRGDTRPLRLGALQVGGGAPVSVQTMTKTDTRDVSATVAQIRRVADLGCDIVRLAVPDMTAAEALADIRRLSPPELPLVADIHFDYRLALAAVASGIDGLRINPGNIGGSERIRAVVQAARPRSLPIRIGVNGGSLERDILERHGAATPEALVESAMRHVALLEAEDYREIKISVKASDVPRTLAAYRLLAQRTRYPLHLGVTEAGTYLQGLVKSAVGIGSLLCDGIGDTIRVSLTDDPLREVEAAREILRAVGAPGSGVSVISCPTCGRTEIDIIPIAKEIEAKTRDIKKDLKVAVMGCIVNGPGEAAEADIGIAGGKDCAMLFKKGVTVRKLEGDIAAQLLEEIRALAGES